MAPIYLHDPEEIQAQLQQALRSASSWQDTASHLHLALFALRCAFNACPSEEGRNAIQQQAHQLQEQHQQAQYTAAACQEACQELARQLARLADDHLSNAQRSDLEEAA